MRDLFGVVFFSAGARITHLAPVAAGLVTIGIAALILPLEIAEAGGFHRSLRPENAADTGYQVCHLFMRSAPAGFWVKVLRKASRSFFTFLIHIRISYFLSWAKSWGSSELLPLYWRSDCFFGAELGQQ